MSTQEISEVVYTADSKLRVGVREACRTIVHNVFHFRALILQYIRRDFVASYRGTALGILWKIILPLVPMSVYIMLHWLGVFGSTVAMPRALYVVAGLTFYELWATSLVMCLNRLNAEANLLKRVQVPLVVVYLTGIGQILFDTMVRMVLLVLLLMAFEVPFSASWLLLPLLCLPLLLFGMGVGILLSFFAVFSRDVSNITSVLIRYGLFASAVIFPLPMEGTVGTIIQFNPMYHLVDGTRNIIVGLPLEHPGVYGFCLLLSVWLFLVALKKTCSMEERLLWAL